MITKKLKITGKIPNIDRILSGFTAYEYNLDKKKHCLILDVTMLTQSGINELVRRLGPKKNRRTTKIEVLSGRRGVLND